MRVLLGVALVLGFAWLVWASADRACQGVKPNAIDYGIVLIGC